MLVEMHSHLLYGVDDGAQTYDEMTALLRQAAENRISHIVCTSHITPGYKRFPAEDYLAHFAEGQRWCQENNPDMQLHIGSEIFYTEHTARLLNDGTVPSLGQTMAVLVEFHPTIKEKEIFDAAENLGRNGYRIVIAHVERYENLNRMERIRQLRDDLQCMIQMNSRSVLNSRKGLLGRHLERKLLDEGLVDFVSSDAHSAVSRPICLKQAHRFLMDHYDSRYADELCGENYIRFIGVDNDMEVLL